MEYKPVQYAKNDYRVLKKENRYTGTFMIRQKSNGFFIPDEKISVDMDIVISSLKVPYLRVSYYGTEQLSIPDGQTLSFKLDNEEIKLKVENKKNTKVIIVAKFGKKLEYKILKNKAFAKKKPIINSSFDTEKTKSLFLYYNRILLKKKYSKCHKIIYLLLNL